MHVCQVDLTLKFNSALGVRGVSLVDYIDAQLNASPKNKPDESQLVVHKYL